MRRIRGFIGGIAVAAAAVSGAVAMKPMKAPRFAAVIKDPAGVTKGSASGTETRGTLSVSVSVSGIAPGVHGLHIHEVGKCDGPAFTTAGMHWNPTMKQHGRDNPMGAHDGDLPNITVGADGRGMARFTVPTTLSSMMDADGASIVVHATADDYRTDPSGNSGGRIACGVLKITR
jgi:superoxide dismutase, Cu-Zn family